MTGSASISLSPRFSRSALPIAGNVILSVSGIGFSASAANVQTALEKVMQARAVRANVREESARERFCRLSARWKDDTCYESLIARMMVHPSYQEIIGMGHDAVPLILNDLAQSPDHWFWALRAITGEDPVRPRQRGDIEAMTMAWLNWGRARGYLRYDSL